MAAPLQVPGRTKPRRWLKYLGVSVIVFALIIVAAMFTLGFVRIAPPVAAQVVDAVTGKPVPGMNICLQAQDLGRSLLESKTTTTGGSGRLFFTPSVHTEFLRSLRGYWIRVTDPAVPVGAACGADINFSELNNGEWPSSLAPDGNGRSKYFPVALLRGDADPYMSYWGAMHRSMDFPIDLRIVLIPFLQNPEDCKQIADPPLAQDCRQLNVYAAAMSLRTNLNLESRTRAEALCSELPHPTISGTCEGSFLRVWLQQQIAHGNIEALRNH